MKEKSKPGKVKNGTSGLEMCTRWEVVSKLFENYERYCVEEVGK